MLVDVVTLRVRYAETDKMQVAHHARYFEWFEVGRTELMRKTDYSYAALEADGIFLPLVEASCRYLRPAKYDDLLRITTELREPPRSTLRLFYRIHTLPDHTLVCRGFTVHAFMNQNGRAVRPPKRFLEALRPFFTERTSEEKLL